MTAEYFLASKSFLSIFLGHKTFCFTVPLILLMSPVHFGLLFPFSSSNHFKFPFLHKACLPWSNFHLLFFSLFFLFFCISILITLCLWFLFQSFHSNFSINLCLSFTSANQETLFYSSGHLSVHFSCQSQLPFLLPQPKIPTPIYPLHIPLNFIQAGSS